jgi:hypothetical protein
MVFMGRTSNASGNELHRSLHPCEFRFSTDAGAKYLQHDGDGMTFRQ